MLGGAPVSVLVAATHLEAGHVLSERDLALRSIPESYLSARHIRFEEADGEASAPVHGTGGRHGRACRGGGPGLAFVGLASLALVRDVDRCCHGDHLPEGV